MDPQRFQGNAAGSLTRVGRGDAAYRAFVPHPLPPALEIDDAMARSLAEAERAVAGLRDLAQTVPDLGLHTGPFLRNEAVYSSRIEGIRVTLGDLYLYEAGEYPLLGYSLGDDESGVRLVSNYVQALEHAPERLHTLPLSLRLIREMHEILMEGEPIERVTPGEFRVTQNWIGEQGALLNQARFVPPPVPEMRQALDAFEKYLHSDDGNPPLIRLALMHYQFEAIHPFVDGNGRLGRMLISLLAAHWNLLPAPLLMLSPFFDTIRLRYVELLLGVSERGDWREWIMFFLRGVAWQAQDARDRLGDLLALRERWRGAVAAAQSPARTNEVIDSLFQQPVISPTRLESRFGLSRDVAVQVLASLKEAGIIEQIGREERDGVFIAQPILQAMGW